MRVPHTTLFQLQMDKKSMKSRRPFRGCYLINRKHVATPRAGTLLLERQEYSTKGPRRSMGAAPKHVLVLDQDYFNLQAKQLQLQVDRKLTVVQRQPLRAGTKAAATPHTHTHYYKKNTQVLAPAIQAV